MTKISRNPEAEHGKLVKVRFTLDSSEWHGSTHETVWAKEVDAGCFVIKNTPFFVFGVSLDDIVSAVKLDDGEIFEFKEKLSESGHSTYRIIPLCAQDDPAFERAVSELNELGAFYEEGPSRLLAFDIPPEANIHAIYQLMEEYAEAGLWDFEEGHFSCLN